MKIKYKSPLQKKYEDFIKLKQQIKNGNLSYLSTSNSIFLLDGMNLFLRNFEAHNKYTSTGNPIGGVYGSLLSLIHIVKHFHPAEIYIIFDGKGGSKYRRNIYPEYKAGRKSKQNIKNTKWNSIEEKEDHARWQLKRFLEYLEYLPVKYRIVDGYEADDVIAWMATEYFKDKEKRITIVSTDKDFFQLISDKVEVYNPIKKIMYNREKFLEEYQILPENYILYKIFEGDKSDNIDGVKGIGKKGFLSIYPETKNKILSYNDLFKLNLKESKAITTNKYNLINESKKLLERNYKLIQLNSTILTSNQQLNLINMCESSPNMLNIKMLQKLLIEDGYIEGAKKLSYWMNNFSYLNKIKK